MAEPYVALDGFALGDKGSPFGTVAGFTESETRFPASTPVHMFRAAAPSQRKVDVAPVHEAEVPLGEAEE